MRLLIMGPPGAGKGTQAKQVAEHYQIPAISTGDIFRAMKHADTPLARQVRAIMESGGYVSDEITNEIVKDRLAQSDCAVGFLLDGYPRTLQQVRTLDDYLAEADRPLDAVISLLADIDEVVARLLKRAEIDGRSDDNEETIRVRLQVYAEQTEPLLEVYRTRSLLVEVDGLGPIDEVSERVFAALDAHRSGERTSCWSLNSHRRQRQSQALGGETDQPGSSIHSDQLSGLDLVRCLRHANHCRNAVLPCDDRAMGVRAAHLHDQAAGCQEQRSPAGIGRRCNQDLAGLEVRAHWVEHDSCPTRHGASRGRTAGEGAVCPCGCDGHGLRLGPIGEEQAGNVPPL